MADIPEPGSTAATITFIVTVIVGVVTTLAGMRKGAQRAAHGAAEGDPVGLGGGAILLDSRALAPIAEDVKKMRLALDRLLRERAEAEEREEQRRAAAAHARLEELARQLEAKFLESRGG